jgi:hypothetical protein
MATVPEDLTRRRFLAQLGTAGVAVSSVLGGTRLARAQAPSPPANVRLVNGLAATSKALLQPADFTYLGAFGIPASSNSYSTSYGAGLAYRYVNGQLRFLSTTFTTGPRFDVFEMTAPAPSKTFYSTATVTRHWGDVYTQKKWLDKYNSSDQGNVYGLFWDPIDQRLYWSYGDQYNADPSNSNDCSLGYSTLDDVGGTGTGVGAWRFGGRGEKMCRGGVLPIPLWFANQYCGGRRLGVGFGGYYSAATVGPASMGPALGAFNPPNLALNPDRSSLPATNLIGYEFHTDVSAPDRARRDTDYTTEFDDWNPTNGVGHFTWNDTLWQSATWIDLPTKHGLLYAATLGNGRNWYEASDRNAERGSHVLYVYDPADLALVAQGVKTQDQIQWRNSWPITFPGLTYPLAGWRGDPSNIVTGVTFDTSTGRLYLMVRWSAGNYANVYVYQVQ